MKSYFSQFVETTADNPEWSFMIISYYHTIINKFRMDGANF